MGCLWIGVFLENSLPYPHHHNGQKQQRNEVSGAHNLKSSDSQLVPKLITCVPPPVVQGLIMFTPEETKRRHGDQENAAWLENAVDFPHAGEIVVHMFQHVQSGGDVDAITLEAHCLGGRGHQPSDIPCPAVT